MTDRHRHQHEVDRLLEAIRHGVEEVELARVRGVRGPALASVEEGLAALRLELAAVVCRQSRPAPRQQRRQPKPTWTPALS